MKRLLAVGLLCIAFAASALAEGPVKIPAHLQKNCVTVRSDNSSGSGAVIVRKVDGVNIAFVWTAYHVIDGLREVKTVLNNGTEKKVVSYRDAQIVQQLISNGATDGEVKLYCKILATSQRNDVALLQVRRSGLYDDGVEFVLDLSVTEVGTELYHCGSPSGQELGHNSITPGIIAANGRMFEGLPYDQVTCSALPGSSGGIVARKDNGKYIGMLTLGIRGSDTFNYIVPVRRIVEWSITNRLAWAVDKAAPAPTNEQLARVKVEDTMNNVDAAICGDAPAPTGTYFLIKRLRPAAEKKGLLRLIQ